ncbi:MAG TPA: hypothetical protein VJJ47_00340 [Candidatus Paceibacterota bacterium]
MSTEPAKEPAKPSEPKKAAPAAPPVSPPVAPPAAPSVAAVPAPSPKLLPTALRRPSRLLRAWLLALVLALLGGAGWAAASVFGRSVVEASANLAASIVPDEALSAAFLNERRAQIDQDAAAVGRLFVARGNPTPLLAEIERQAKVAGADASVASVAVAPYDGQGDPSWSGATAVSEDSAAPYALVIVTVEASGSWKPIASFARALEALPYASRVERLRLSVEQGKKGGTLWTLRAEVRAIAR